MSRPELSLVTPNDPDRHEYAVVPTLDPIEAARMAFMAFAVHDAQSVIEWSVYQARETERMGHMYLDAGNDKQAASCFTRMTDLFEDTSIKVRL